MLTKNYSTATILFAATVIDGGKKLDDVPALFKVDVSELIKTVAGDSPAADTKQVPADASKETVVITPDSAKKEG